MQSEKEKENRQHKLKTAVIYQFLCKKIVMTSIIKFQALSGAKNESPPCFLLQVDECRILLDCGWDEKFDLDMIKEIKKHVSHVDAVLLSHADPLHLGALPYLVGKCGLSCPVYATIPVYKMGQMFMYDLYQSRYNMEDFSLFTLDDVDAAFDKVIQLKYHQSMPLKGKGYGVTVTPLPAGHTIGGTIWKISKAGEEDIIYAIDYNHKKERHLNGFEVDKLGRPALLITDALNATYQQARRRIRDERLMTNILQTLRGGGNVLVAVDTAGRVLELAHMLEQLWRNKDSGLLAYSLALLSNVCYNTIEFAKSQIEWMSEKLMKSFEGVRNNPFQFKHTHLCHSFQELNRVPGPKVVLASCPDLESGFSRDLFLQWAGNSANSIILTMRTSPGTLARDIIDNGGDRLISIQVKRRIKLEGAELDSYKKLKADSEQEVELSSDSDDELQLVEVTRGRHDFVFKDTKPQQGYFKTSKKQNAMFPFTEKKVKVDDYGEVVNADEFRVDQIDREDTKDIKEEFISADECKTAEPEAPSKCVVSTRQLEIRAQINFIDFEGRSDGESVQKIVCQIRPRKLIIVRGSPDCALALQTAVAKSSDAKIFIPQKLELVDATTESHIYQIKLTDQLLSSLHFQKGKNAEVAWLDAADRTKSMSSVVEDDDIPTLDIVPADLVPGHQTTFFNELKLSDFKQVLSKHQIPCEFSGGVLWCCHGTVAVRRHEAGRVILEGCLSEDYFRVQELLYEQYAIV